MHTQKHSHIHMQTHMYIHAHTELETVWHTHTCMYMGSSSVLVLTGSHSLCNSFVVNQFLFFTPNQQLEKIPFVIHPRSNESNTVDFFNIYLFFISKIYSHVTQKWRPKTGMAIPYCLCWKLLHTRRKYSDISNLFAKLQHAKAPES